MHARCLHLKQGTRPYARAPNTARRYRWCRDKAQSHAQALAKHARAGARTAQLRQLAQHARFERRRCFRAEMRNRPFTGSDPLGIQTTTQPKPCRGAGQRDLQLGIVAAAPVKCRTQVVKLRLEASERISRSCAPTLGPSGLEERSKRYARGGDAIDSCSPAATSRSMA